MIMNVDEVFISILNIGVYIADSISQNVGYPAQCSFGVNADSYILTIKINVLVENTKIHAQKTLDKVELCKSEDSIEDSILEIIIDKLSNNLHPLIGEVLNNKMHAEGANYGA